MATTEGRCSMQPVEALRHLQEIGAHRENTATTTVGGTTRDMRHAMARGRINHTRTLQLTVRPTLHLARDLHYAVVACSLNPNERGS